MSGTPPPAPTPPPHGKDASSAGGAAAAGYPPPPNIVGPKLTANDYYHQQHQNQIPTGAHQHHQHQHQQQQPPPRIHRNEPPPILQPTDRWLLPMYHHQSHHRTPMDSHLDRHSLPLESQPETRDFKGGEKDISRGSVSTGGDHKELKFHSDNWDALRSNLQEGPNVGDRDYIGSHEAVGENRVEPKGEDRYKEKDRKRKDLKHRDWGGDRDKDRSERRTSLQVGSGSGEGVKEPSTREERELDRWDREKKDPSKDREKPKEREKDPVKRENWNGEKDGLNIDKEPTMDVSGRTPERETSTIEQKKQKDHDGWKSADREGRERRKERDGDVEPERPEKRSRVCDKESDDGYGDADGSTEKERESFSYGVQQRKRMLRPRGSPQVGNREPRFRSNNQDNEGTQGKPEISTVIYRVGACMQELIKLWKEYESLQADKNGESSQASPTLEIRIPAEYITATNRQVKGGQLWGTDVYTDDSDLVAVLMHTGYCRPTSSPPPPAIQELRATVRVLPPQDSYTSTLRNNVRSRAWGAAIGCSYRVERCCILKKGGGSIDLEPCLTHTSTVEPTLAPVAVERTMTTRAAASNALRQQRFVREVTIQYNLCNEPWIKYSLSVVADKGLKKPLYTSARLKKGEVLYVETRSRRYELCFTGEKMVKAAIPPQTQEMDVEKTQSHNLHPTNGERERSGLMDGDTMLIDVFRWSRCKRPLPQNLLRSSGVPLPSEHLEVLEENLDWEDIRWSQTGVFIAGKEYALARLHFMSPN